MGKTNHHTIIGERKELKVEHGEAFMSYEWYNVVSLFTRHAIHKDDNKFLRL